MVLFFLNNFTIFDQVVDVEGSQVIMYGTKVEVKLKKAEPGTWTRLEIPKVIEKIPEKSDEKKITEEITPKIDAVDLDDL